MTTIHLPLLVADDAFVVQLPARDGLDHAFYDTLSPFTPVVWVHSAIREFENQLELEGEVLGDLSAEAQQHLIGMRNRGLYLQLLESLFAHFFANAQFPFAPQAWLSKYKPSKLRQLASHLHSIGWTAPATVEMLKHPDALVTWLFGVEQMGSLSAEDRAAETAAVVRILTTLAADYSSKGHDLEYNSAKHGIRAMPGAWSITMSETGNPERKVGMRASHGTHFLVEERGRGRSAKHYFTLRRRSQSWHPERDLALCLLCSKLLHNLIAARQTPGKPKPLYLFAGYDLSEIDLPRQSLLNQELGVPLDLPESPLTVAQAKEAAVDLSRHFVDFIQGREAHMERMRAGSSNSDAPTTAGDDD